MYYQVFKDQTGQWRWHLRAANNKIVAASGESYWNKSDCLAGVALVKQSYNAPVYE